MWSGLVGCLRTWRARLSSGTLRLVESGVKKDDPFWSIELPAKGSKIGPSKIGGLLYVEGSTMTPETKKSAYWTGSALAALIVVLAILWATGILQTPPAQ